jgi:hypothetical protein
MALLVCGMEGAERVAGRLAYGDDALSLGPQYGWDVAQPEAFLDHVGLFTG